MFVSVFFIGARRACYGQGTRSAGLGSGVPVWYEWTSASVPTFILGLQSPVLASPGLRPGIPVPVPAFGRHSQDQSHPVPECGPATSCCNIDFDAKFAQGSVYCADMTQIDG